MRRHVVAWLPPLVWMAVILWLSSDAWSAPQTTTLLAPWLRLLFPWATPVDLTQLHAAARKGAHIVEYAILALLWLRAVRGATRLPEGMAIALALAVSAAWAIVDEVYQATVTTRTGSPVDVGIDVLGATLALAVAATGWRRCADRLTTIMLWTAALGGAVVLALNWFTGAESRAVWLTVPVAVVALALRARHRHGARARPVAGSGGAAATP